MQLIPHTGTSMLHEVVPKTQSHGPTTETHHNYHHHNDNGRLPKLNFPFYEGETTRLWISQAEDYFEMYDVPPRRWVKVSRMHFQGAVARWIESIEQPRSYTMP
jgi:broad specificity phosphatase PhoE